jgi:O-antigen/teichoic acid export membrane protein
MNPPLDDVRAGRRKLSLRRNFAWNFGGVSLYNLSQWILLLVLARLSDPASVGQFSLMLAISAPVFLTVGLNLRTVQATDAARQWRLEEYLVLRQVLNVIATAVTIVAGLLFGLHGWDLAALAVVCVAKSLEAGSQVLYGYFQLRERLDLVSRSLLARAIAGPALFLLGFWSTKQLAVAAAGLAIGWGAAQVLLDQRNARMLSRLDGDHSLGRLGTVRWSRVVALARKAAPLGLDQGVSSLCANIPRYLIKALIGSAHLGVYASQAYLAQVISMITSAMATVFVPRMAVYYHQGRRRAFVRMLLILVLFGLIVLAIAVTFAVFLGAAFIRLTLGADYVNQPLLIALMVGAGATTLQRNLCKTMEASQSFGNYLLVDSITAAAILVSAVPLIQAYGILGAAYSIIIGFSIGSVAVLVAMLGVMRRMPSPSNGSDPRQSTGTAHGP